ncbi:DUF6078 family protein [Parabacteroides sp. OttesenSCG-928-O15]|nr:DUF6078 family protein [Parabacteroides sp. OttesenSCG-928-O15]
MKEDFDYNQVPQDYLHCLQATCPRSTDCLRFQAARHADNQTTAIKVINPAHIASKEDDCPYFRKCRLVCFAIGITALFDNLPYAKAIKVRNLLRYHLHRTTYYRILRKERYITPEEQSLICEVFRRVGIEEEPLFDECIYRHDW